MSKVCPNGHKMDPSWKVCPYCQSADSAAPSSPVPASADALKKTLREVAPGIAESPEPRKTMRLSERRPPVVGWLVDLDGAQKGEDFRLRDGKVTLGAGADCQIRLQNSFASDRHASLRCDGGRYILTDLDTTNGTKVNGKAIARCELADGDRIQIGETTYVFKGLFVGAGES